MSNLKQNYIALIKAGAVRDVQICTNEHSSPEEDSAWCDMCDAEVYLGIYTGEDAREQAALYASTAPENIRLIPVPEPGQEPETAPNASVSLILKDASRGMSTYSVAELSEKMGVQDIKEIILQVKNRNNIAITAAADVIEQEYPAITIDGKDANDCAMYLAHAELPNECYPDSITTRLYAGYECCECDAPIAMTVTRICSKEELDQRARQNIRTPNVMQKKLVHIDYDVAQARAWNETASLQEHDPEYKAMANEKKFVLIEVAERGIEAPKYFSTREAAVEHMLSRLKSVANLTDEQIADAKPCSAVTDKNGNLIGSTRTIDDEIYFSDWSASCEIMGENYDWKIFEL